MIDSLRTQGRYGSRTDVVDRLVREELDRMSVASKVFAQPGCGSAADSGELAKMRRLGEEAGQLCDKMGVTMKLSMGPH